MYSTVAKSCEMHFIIRLNRSFRSDLLWWHTFLQYWNGLSILRHPAVMHPNFYARFVGLCGSVWSPLAEVGMASRMVQNRNNGKRTVPIFNCVVWEHCYSRHHINFCFGNTNLVNNIGKGSSKHKFIMHQLRSLFFLVHTLITTFLLLTYQR